MMRAALLLIVLATIAALPGCGFLNLFRHAPMPAAPTAQPSAHDDDTNLDLAARLNNARKDLADAQGRVDSLAVQVRAEHDELLARQLAWVSLLCLIGCGACIAVAIWLPVGRKMAVAGAASFIAVGILALCARSILPYLPWIGLALLAIAGVAAVIVLYPQLWTLREIAPKINLDHILTTRARNVLLAHCPKIKGT